MHQPTRICATDVACATSASPAMPPSAPPSSQGRRMPWRQVVRSDRWPKNGLPNNASKAPVPITSDRSLAACAGSIARMRRVRPTRTGDSKAIHMPV